MGQALNNQPRSLSPLVLLFGISKVSMAKRSFRNWIWTINNGESHTAWPFRLCKTTVLRLIAGSKTVDAGHIMLM